MTGPLLVLGIVAVVAALDVWFASRVGRFVGSVREREGRRTTTARFLGGRR